MIVTITEIELFLAQRSRSLRSLRSPNRVVSDRRSRFSAIVAIAAVIWKPGRSHTIGSIHFERKIQKIETMAPSLKNRSSHNCYTTGNFISHSSHVQFCLLEQFSIECRKTKTKVITLTNHSLRRRSNEPINLTG